MQQAKTDGSQSPPASIESLYAAQESALLIYAQKLVNHTETAQDIVQEAFLKLHAGFDSVHQPQAWLYRTVHNLAVNHLRKNSKIVPLVIEDSDPSKAGPSQHSVDVTDTKPLPDEYLTRMEAIGRTRICLAKLDARSRELIRLKFDEGLSYKEIADQTHLTISNVGYLLHHAVKAVAAALRKEQS
jgi:RNA polymerase sigma-70 factor (ECF subfamily)